MLDMMAMMRVTTVSSNRVLPLSAFLRERIGLIKNLSPVQSCDRVKL